MRVQLQELHASQASVSMLPAENNIRHIAQEDGTYEVCGVWLGLG